MTYPDIRPIDHLPGCGEAAATALVLREEVLDYAALEAAVGRLAGALAALGLAPGARVASWCAKTWVACLMPLAAPRAGLVHVPINPLLKRAQVAHILADSAASLLIAGEARLASLIAGDLPDGCATWSEADARARADAAAPLPPSEADPDALAALLYTSGSTGRPKGVMLSHANLWLGAVSVARYLGLGADDRTLAVLPLSFDYGQNQLLSTWFAGGAAVPLDYLAARDVIAAVARHGVTTLAGVPPLWVQLIEAEWPAEAIAPLRRLTNSGGRVPVPLVRALRERFPQAKLFLMYGLTEAFRSTFLDPALAGTHPDSIGTAIPFAEVLAVRPDGSETAPDEPGELVHVGPLVAQGYWRDAERTALRFRPAPPASRLGGTAVFSGDTVRRDAQGLLYFVGRDDAMIKTSGNRVSPTEIEEAVVASGHAAEAVALGRPDERVGAAIVVVARGSAADEDALRATLRQSLPNFMQPAEIVWREELPRNPNGKLDREALAREVIG